MDDNLCVKFFLKDNAYEISSEDKILMAKEQIVHVIACKDMQSFLSFYSNSVAIYYYNEDELEPHFVEHVHNSRNRGYQEGPISEMICFGELVKENKDSILIKNDGRVYQLPNIHGFKVKPQKLVS